MKNEIEKKLSQCSEIILLNAFHLDRIWPVACRLCVCSFFSPIKSIFHCPLFHIFLHKVLILICLDFLFAPFLGWIKVDKSHLLLY